ncbi:MAG: hypothetical protein V4617_19525 [Gemmatimonadota bacterium]
MPRMYAIAVCAARSCRRTVLGASPASAQRDIEASLLAVVRQHAEHLQTASPTRADHDVASTVALLPANNRTLVPLSETSRDAFTSRLRARLASYPVPQAETSTPFDDATALAAGPNGMDTMMFLGCAACRGHCCTRGGTHAFLSADGLRAIAARETDGDTGHALEALYTRHLPVTHYENSCVFHGELGCTLPRTLRSDTCNRYLCGELAVLRRQLERGPELGAVVGAATWSGLERIAVLDARGVTDVPIHSTT